MISSIKRLKMEMTILQLIQSWHNPFLDKLMVVVFNDFVGAKGEIWVILGLILPSLGLAT